jgi:hypothetical protein
VDLAEVLIELYDRISFRALLETRRAQAQARIDPAASLVERFGLSTAPPYGSCSTGPSPLRQARHHAKPSSPACESKQCHFVVD